MCEEAGRNIVSGTEITPEMIESGAEVLWAWAGGEFFPFDSDEGRTVAERVFLAMVGAAKS